MARVPPITAILPTHSHGSLLRYAAASVLAQEVDGEIELLIAGDGMDDATRSVATALAAGDERIRLLDLPKAPRVGELNRDAAVGEARGELILYACDDDLWMPHHAAVIAELIEAGAELAVGVPIAVLPNGSYRAIGHDYADSRYRDLLAHGVGRVSLPAIGHRRDAYGGPIPRWRTTDGRHSDLDLAQRYVAGGGELMVSATRPSVVRLASPQRQEMSPSDRERELASWWSKISDPDSREALEMGGADLWRLALLDRDVQAEHHRIGREKAERSVGRLQTRVDELSERNDSSRERIEALRARVDEQNEVIASLRGRAAATPVRPPGERSAGR